MKSIFDRYLVEEDLTYWDIGHAQSEEEEETLETQVWMIFPDDDDIRVSKKGLGISHDWWEYISGDESLPHGANEFAGRIDHNKKMISMSGNFHRKISPERVQYVKSLLRMDYPGYKIAYWNGSVTNTDPVIENMLQPDMFSKKKEDDDFRDIPEVIQFVKKRERDESIVTSRELDIDYHLKMKPPYSNGLLNFVCMYYSGPDRMDIYATYFTKYYEDYGDAYKSERSMKSAISGKTWSFTDDYFKERLNHIEHKFRYELGVNLGEPLIQELMSIVKKFADDELDY